MPFLQTSYTTLYYEMYEANFTSPAPPACVLLLHGFAGTPESDFEAQLPLLRDRFRVLAPHLRGYGRSSHRSSYRTSYYREDMADMLELLDALAIDEVRVLGFSDGAIVGLLLAALHPTRVSALAALGAQPSITAQDAAAIRYWFLERPVPPHQQIHLAELHGDPYWRTLPRMYVEAQDALVEAGGVLITDEELRSIRCPALIMHGSRDKVVPAEYARVIAEGIPSARLLLFDAGHAAHLRCEKEYTGAVMEFFQ